MTIHFCNFKNPFPKFVFQTEKTIDTTSRSKNWTKGLSPFFLGPVDLYNGYTSENVENGWQFSKVFSDHVDGDQNPTKEYFAWATYGWNLKRAIRYPMGKNIKPLYSYWNGEKLNYVEARKKIYAPLYAKAVEKTDAYKQLKELYDKEKEIWLWDFDNYNHRDLNMSYQDVINCSTKKMGHSFVLAMMLENQRVWEI